MEEIIIQQTKELKIYRTTDGKEFDSEIDAQKHEDKLWWGENVSRAIFNDEEYFHYVVVDDAGYQTFVRCLCRYFSGDFGYAKKLSYPAGTKLFARVEEYSNDYSDTVVMYTYERFVSDKQETIDILTEELGKFVERFKDKK